MTAGLRKACLSAAVLSALYGENAARAADLIWDPAGSTTSGSDGSGNWDNVTPIWFNPATNSVVTFSSGTPDSATFGTSTTATGTADDLNVFLASNITAQNITLNTAASGAAYDIFDQGNGQQTLTLKGNFIKGGVVGAPQVLLANAMVLTTGVHTFAAGDSGGDLAPELTFNSAITGAGSITVDNTLNYTGPVGSVQYGTIAFNTDNTYTGGTTIQSGRLVVNTSGGLGTGAVNITGGGQLAFSGAGTTNGDLTINNALTIGRSDYTTANTNSNYKDAIVANNDGGANTIVLNNVIVNSTDARITANTNTINLPNSITAGSIGASTAVLDLGGDFAGVVNLSGDNTAYGAAGGTIGLRGGVEVNVSSEANLGGATSKLLLGGGTIHPTGTLGASGSAFMTNFGAHNISGTAINTGLDLASNQTFTANNLSGVGIGTRGTGTINFNGTNTFTGTPFFDGGVANVNGTTSFGGFRLRSATLNIPAGSTVTTTGGFSDIGSDSPDNGTLNLAGTLNAGNFDFNVTDNAGTQGTFNLTGAAVFSTPGRVFVGKSANTVAAVNMGGSSSFTANSTGVPALGIGTVNGATGTFTKTSTGALTVNNETWVGNSVGGVGTFSQSAGTTTVNNWLAIGRTGALGTMNLTGGTFTKQGDNNAYVGESTTAVTSTLTLSNAASYVGSTGEFWVGQGGGSGILTIQNSASFTNNNWIAIARASGTSRGVINFTGGTFTKTANSNGYLAVGSGGQAYTVNSVTQDGGVFNQTGTNTVLNVYGTRVGEASNGTMNLSAGTSNFTGEFSIGVGANVVGTLNISGTSAVTVPDVVFGVGDVNNTGTAGTAGGVLNLNGGTLTANSFSGGNGGGTKVINFNGGQLIAASASTNFINPVGTTDGTTVGTGVTTNVLAGGAKISTNGNAVTISAPLAHAASLGTTADGGLAVSGTGGTLTLSAVNTYTGPTAVTGTTALAIASTGSITTSTLNSTTAIANAGTISESGGGSVSSITGPGTLNVTGGTLQLANPTLGTINSQSAVNIAGGGIVDIRKNQLQIASGNYTKLVNYYKAGSLTSSDAASASGTRVVGIVDNGTVTTARYTTYGDVNLDGRVNGQDVAAINGANAFGGPAGSATYSVGDTNYDNRFNGADVSRINAANAFGTGVITNAAFDQVVSPAAIPVSNDNSKINLQYDPATGNLTVITNGVGYGTITLGANSSVFKDGVFGTSPEFYSDDNGDGTSLFFGVLIGQQTTNVVLPGVLDPNQSLSSLLAAISVTGVTNGPAAANITFSSTNSTPEPAALAGLAVLAGGMLRRQRVR